MAESPSNNKCWQQNGVKINLILDPIDPWHSHLLEVDRGGLWFDNDH
jgi:hypothetical protein